MSPNHASRRILVAVAWPYASGPRHLGHVAGFGVPSDIFARYHRLRGDEVLMVSGTDEHGTPITVASDREGIPPKAIADKYSQIIGDDLQRLGLSYDIFTRTTTKNHYEVVQQVFATLYEKGYLVKKTQLGAFDPRSGRTLPDRYIEGTCPICGFGEARGDQCDNCGNQLDPTDLINPRSRIDGATPEFRETEHFFIDLPAFAPQLTEWIEGHKEWRTNVRNFSLQFVRELKPRAITRDLDWGVPIPLEGWREQENKRIYVWFDAVLGYLTATIEWAKYLAGAPTAWQGWWDADADCDHFYFMGKDNIVFHTVIWPAILLGAGYKLPREVVASEFLTMEGKKFSSSRGVVIYVNDFLSRYDPDPLRYFIAVAGPENQDTDFTWAEFVRRNNDELVANWGNLVNRVLVNTQRNFGVVPAAGELTERDRALLAQIEAGFEKVGGLIARAGFQAAIKEAMRLSSEANAYLADEEPWKTIKTDRDRAATVLHVGLRAVDALKVMFTPFMPFSSQKLHAMLGHDGYLAGPLYFKEIDEGGDRHRVLTGDYETWLRGWGPPELPVGKTLPVPQPLFKKLDEKLVDEELARMGAND